jgi:periplasmic protein TonB
MPLGLGSVSRRSLKESLGSLRSCLVEGDAEQRSRERHVRRCSLLISVVTQAAVLALLILVPLFGKSAHIALAFTTPILPYGPSGHPHGDRRLQNSGTTSLTSHFQYDVSRPLTQPTPAGASSSANANGDPIGISLNEGPGCSGCVDIGGRNSGPRPPQPPATETPARPAILHFTRLDPAMLIRRVEPVYPPLAIQIHREGRVELRAIIATDGTIRSLEIVSGDPIFYQSALEAVRQWCYKPTILNGQPVEIDTHITVIYTVSH